jgi:hypothetical protein
LTERQQQKGGETQLQAGRDIILHTGLNYEAVKDIVESHAAQLRQELTVHAKALYDERLEMLEERVLRTLTTPELIGAFADPDFQFNILEAQRSAARTDRSEDIDLLIDILAQRAVTPESPRLKVATRKALDVVGQLNDDALQGLTLLWYGISLVPIAYTLPTFLTTLDGHLKVLSHDLPVGASWLSDLALLDCITLGVGGIGNLKNFVQLVGENKAPGFICVGMDSETAERHRTAFVDIHPSLSDLIVDHPFAEDRYQLVGPGEPAVKQLTERVAEDRGLDEIALRTALDAAIIDNQYESQIGGWPEMLRTKVREYDALARIDDWWGDNFVPLSVTPVGIAVGYANLRRLLPNVLDPSIAPYLSAK